MVYKYGKTFKKDGKLVRYRYTDGKKSTKKLVAVNKKKEEHTPKEVIVMCPKCGSTKMDIYIVDDSNPKQPIVHCCCETCGTEWVE